MPYKRKYKPKGDGKLTVEECGRRGGLKTKEKMPADFYAEIGRKGGRAGKGGRRNKEETEGGQFNPF